MTIMLGGFERSSEQSVAARSSDVQSTKRNMAMDPVGKRIVSGELATVKRNFSIELPQQPIRRGHESHHQRSLPRMVA